MDALTCSIQALIACFQLSNLYISGGVLTEDVSYVEVDPITREIVADPSNFLADISIGFSGELSRQWSFDLRLYSHRSDPFTGRDRGVNSGGLFLYWRPFRH